MRRGENPHLIVPVGTQVVLRQDTRAAGGVVVLPRGTVGEIIKSPSDATHAYRARLPDGSEVSLRRHEYSILKQVKKGPLREAGAAVDEDRLFQYVIFRCVVGSQAYGLSHDESDVDRRGIYLPPAELHWSLYGVPEQLERLATEEVYWELQKFLVLALKANPNVLECLYTPLYPQALRDAVASHRYPLLFATLSGAHLYGFASPDSDYDLRGVHILPVREVLRLEQPPETIEVSETSHGIELDLVTHDARKFFLMLLKRNGYVLEQLFSPLVLHALPEHRELQQIARGCITRRHAHHYLGFAETQWSLFEKEEPRRVKPLLYTYRVLLTGIHLMRTGEIEANLVTLNEIFGLRGIPELIERKRAGSEQAILGGAEVETHRLEFERLRAQLEDERDRSSLPDAPSARRVLSDFLLRLREKYGPAGSR